MGYYLAGFDVIGVDVKPQRQYPFGFIRRDALSVLRDRDLLAEFDAIHASPPHSDLLTPTIELLDGLPGLPWVVENVEFTRKMPGSVTLCGTHFNLGASGRALRRHRRFLASFRLPRPGPCWCSGTPVGGVYGRANGPVLDGYRFDRDEARIAMGIDWMSRTGLTLAVPPDYTRWIGEQLLRHLHASPQARDHQHERFQSGRIEQMAQS